MKCIELEELISLYIDNRLDEHTKNLIENHIGECKDCKYEYETLVSSINMCRELPTVQLPEDYGKTLHEKLIAVKEESNVTPLEKSRISASHKNKKKFNWKIYSSIAAVFIILFITMNALNVINIGKLAPRMEMAQENSTKAPAEIDRYSVAEDSMGSGEAAPELKMFTTSESQSMLDQDFGSATEEKMKPSINTSVTGRKVINNAFVNLDIEQYDEKFDQLVNLITSKGGYIEHSDTQYKYYVPEKPEDSLKTGNISARIPQDIFLTTVNEIKSMGIVTNFGIGGQDITMQYRDTANEVVNLKIQEERLREIMLKAENVKDILEVESELTRVRGSINRLSGDIERWDDLVELSTVNISLNEVFSKDKRIQPVSDNLWDKAGKGFIRTINNLLEFAESLFVRFVSYLPIIILVLLAIIPVIMIIKRIRRRE